MYARRCNVRLQSRLHQIGALGRIEAEKRDQKVDLFPPLDGLHGISSDI